MKNKDIQKSENLQNRNAGIDFLRVLCTLLIVAIHTINSTFGLPHRMIVSTCVIGIPIFFITSGLFILGNENISYFSIIKKIGKILAICLIWEFLYSLMWLVVKQEWRPFFVSFLNDFLQKGLFYHFWYLGALIILYLLSPLLNKLIKRNFRLFVILTICLGIINISVDMLQFIQGKQFVLSIIQTFRLWSWLFYFMLGGIIDVLLKKRQISTKLYMYGIFISYFIMVTWLLIGRKYVYKNLIIECSYGSFAVILLAFICSVYFYNTTITNSTLLKLSGLAKYNMGVYIIHPFVLSIIGHFFEKFTSDKLLNILFCVIVYLVSLIITKIIYKIPIINQLIKI